MYTSILKIINFLYLLDYIVIMYTIIFVEQCEGFDQKQIHKAFEYLHTKAYHRRKRREKEGFSSENYADVFPEMKKIIDYKGDQSL